MKIRRDYQIACPICHAGAGRPCKGKQGERLPGVHFQRTTALRAAGIAAFKSLYAPLTARGNSRYKGCPICAGKQCIPIGTPAAQAILANLSVHGG